MKKCFISKSFSDEATAMIARINRILADYASQGYDLTLRQLYYQLVAAAVIENSERSYKNIGSLVSDARLAGLVDWDMITDRGREMVKNSHWSTPADILRGCAQQFRIDTWADQPNHVEVMVEKQALEGVLLPVCSELDVNFTANKGYSSSSAMYEAGRRMADAMANDKRVHVIYLGDHDPSGIDMSRDILTRLNLFADVLDEDAMKRAEERDEDIDAVLEADFEDAIKVHRIALNMDQIRQFRPPENPAKITDSRAGGYIAKFGRSSWELDAIEPRRLARLVRTAVTELRDEEIAEKAEARQQKMRDELGKLAKAQEDKWS
jgi:hypothetical protein